MFDFLKKDGGDAPPDVGQEDKFDEAKEKKKPSKKSEESVITPVKPDPEPEPEPVTAVPAAAAAVAPVQTIVAKPGISKLEVDRLNARVEALQSLLKSFNERFSVVGQQIGEVRAMNLANEKSMSKSKIESAKASDIVKEVKPDKLRVEYQKLDMKMETLSEKIEANNQYAKTVMNEVKDLRHKAGVFLGTDALLQLNDDVKKDLIQLQKLSSRVRINADKSEQLFVELREGFADSQKLSGMVTNLDSFASDLKEEIDKLKLDHSDVVKQKTFGDFQKNVNNKFLGVDSTVEEIERVKGENERLGRVIENIFSVVKRNQSDIGVLGLKAGKKGIKKVDDYDGKILDILRVMEKMAGEVKAMRGQKKVGVVKGLNVAGKDNLEDLESVKQKVKSEVMSSVKPAVKKIVKPAVKKIVKPAVKKIVKQDISKIGKVRGVRDLEEIKTSAEKSMEKPEPLIPVVKKVVKHVEKKAVEPAVKKVVKPAVEVDKNKSIMTNIEKELKNIKKVFEGSDVEDISSKVDKDEEKGIAERVREDIVIPSGVPYKGKKKTSKKKSGRKKVERKKGKKKVEKEKPVKKKVSKKKSSKKNWIEKAKATRRKNANKKAKLKASRLRNLKRARNAKKEKRETMLKNLKKARAVRIKKLKKK
jgi:hypothetical protein